MTNTLKYIIVAVVAVLIGLGAGYYLDHQSASQPLVGAVNARPAENYDPYIRTNGGYYSNLPIQTTGGMFIGATGSQINKIIEGQCVVFTNTATIAASTTATYDCDATSTATTNTEVAITGIQKGDYVVINNATTTGVYATGTGLDTVGVVASSTNGYLSILFANQTGGTFTWPTTASTTISFIDFK